MDPNVSDDLIETILRNISVRSVSSAKIPSIEKYGESFVLNIPDGQRAVGASKSIATSILKVNAFGNLSDRVKYDNAKAGFVFLDNESKQAYVKGKSIGLWSNPIPFTNTPDSGGTDTIDFETLIDEIIPLSKLKGGESLSLEIKNFKKDFKLFSDDFNSSKEKINQFSSQISEITSQLGTAVSKSQEASSRATEANSRATEASSRATEAITKTNLLSNQVLDINNILPLKLNSDFSNLSGDLNISGKIKTNYTADKTINLNLQNSIKEGNILFGKVASNTIPVLRFVSKGSSATWTMSLPKDLVKDLSLNNKFKFKLLWSSNNNLAEKVNWELKIYSYNLGETISSNPILTLNKVVSAPSQELNLTFTEFDILTKDFKDIIVINLTRIDSNNIEPNLMGFEINYPALSLDKS
jgi:outer membrane murein-binding lipoprotein Lpp